MAEEQITIEMEGLEEERGEIRFADFIAELNALRISLHRTQEEITSDPNPVSYRVSTLSYASPYKVGIAIASKAPAHIRTPNRIARRYTSTLRMVRNNHRFARRIDPEVLDSLKGLSSQVHKGIKSIKVRRESEPEISLDYKFMRNLDVLTMTEQSERDEISGKLDQLNIHNKLSQFHIYPSLGPKRILCKAKKKMREKIIANAGRRVLVEGIAHYRKDAPFAHEMDVIDIHPFLPDDELPRMSDLYGIAPRATGELTPEDFVREFRNANW